MIIRGRFSFLKNFKFSEFVQKISNATICRWSSVLWDAHGCLEINERGTWTLGAPFNQFTPFTNDIFPSQIPQGRQLLSCRHGKLGEIFISWKFLENEMESKTPTRNGPQYAFQSTNIYVVHLSESFLNRLQNVSDFMMHLNERFNDWLNFVCLRYP